MTKGKICIVLIIIVGLFTGINYGGTLTFNKIFEWGTGCYFDVAVKGNYAYCAASGAGLDILNISNPSNSIKVGNCLLPKLTRNVEVYGNYAYTTNESDPLQVIDISNPASPNRIGQIGTSIPVKLWLFGQYLYASSFGGGISIYSLANPRSPQLLSTYTGNGYICGSIYVSGNYMVTTWTFNIEIIDISNLASPTKVSSYSYSSPHSFYPNCAVITGNYVIIGESTEYLHIVDISTPSNPVYAGRYRVGTRAPANMNIVGSTLYVRENGGVFRVFSLANPLSPVLLGTCTPSQYNYGLTVSGNYAYLPSSDEGLQIVNISNSSSPYIIGIYDHSGAPNAIEVSGNYAYTIGTSMDVFNISNPSNSYFISSNTSIDGLGSQLVGNHIFLAGRGFRAVDISNPYSPVQLFEIGKYIIDEDWDVAIIDHYAYVSDSDDGFALFDFSDLSNPVYITSSRACCGKGLAIKEDYLYINEGPGFEIFDLSIPSDPIRTTYWEDVQFSWMCADPVYSVIYNAMYSNKSQTWKIVSMDVSASGTALWAGSIAVPGSPCHLFASKHYVYVADGENGLYVYDFTNPYVPVFAGNYSTNIYVTDVKVVGNYVYLVGGDTGKFIILKQSEAPAPSLTVTSPNGGESWYAGSTHAIKWTSSGVTGKVSIYLMKNGEAVMNIGTASASSGSYSWKIPYSVNNSNSYKIQVSGTGVCDDSDSVFSIITAAPTIFLSRETLNFRGIAGQPGRTTSAQAVRISNTGGGTLNWTATPNQSWLHVTPNSGTGNRTISVSVDINGLNTGTYTGSVAISDSTADNSPRFITVTLNINTTGTVPFGEFSTPQDGGTANGSIPVTGWVLDDIESTAVKIFRKTIPGESGDSLVYVGDAIFVEGARPDVEIAFPDYPYNYRAGWGYMLLSNFLPNNGNGIFTLVAKAYDIEGNETTLGEKIITCDNAHEKRPFGAIDTPTQGGNASGSSYVNFGWVLTPYPNAIPTDGSTIIAFIDGKPVGHVVYNQYRVDVATLFLGYVNSNGAGGYLYFNTNNYEDGLHTISWSVIDNAGNENGIGSRFFTIQNDSQLESSITKSFGECRTLFSKRVLPAGGTNSMIEQKTIQPLQRIEIKPMEGIHSEDTLTLVDGYMKIGDEFRALPVGSTLDIKNGIFYWQPGPGFIGDFNIVFLMQDSEGNIIEKNIIISIR